MGTEINRLKSMKPKIPRLASIKFLFISTMNGSKARGNGLSLIILLRHLLVNANCNRRLKGIRAKWTEAFGGSHTEPLCPTTGR